MFRVITVWGERIQGDNCQEKRHPRGKLLFLVAFSLLYFITLVVVDKLLDRRLSGFRPAVGVGSDRIQEPKFGG
jgi:hypothetical protein